MVAQQTLTLYAWVRILVPLPKKRRPSFDGRFFFPLAAELRPEPSVLPIGQSLGSHTPTEDRQARLSGEGSGYLHRDAERHRRASL